MKLDTRILPGKKPLGAFTLEDARVFIRQTGYFAMETTKNFTCIH